MKHWKKTALTAACLGLYGTVAQLLLLRTFLAWLSGPQPRESAGVSNAQGAAFALLGGALFAFLMPRIVRGTGAGGGTPIIRRLKVAALAALATPLAVQSFLLLAAAYFSWSSTAGTARRPGELGVWGAAVLSLIDIETYGLPLLLFSLPFAVGSGLLWGIALEPAARLLGQAPTGPQGRS